MKNVFGVIFVLAAIIVAGCQSQPTLTNSPIAVKSGAAAPASAKREEPFYELSPKKFREAWMAFIKDGRYRMAQTTEVGGMPYHYGFSNEVLVIVVDQTLSDDARLKLAFFQAPENNNGAYKLYWVDHNLNLANSRISNASSVLYVLEGGDPATRSASLRWDAKRRRFTCLVT